MFCIFVMQSQWCGSVKQKPVMDTKLFVVSVKFDNHHVDMVVRNCSITGQSSVLGWVPNPRTEKGVNAFLSLPLEVKIFCLKISPWKDLPKRKIWRQVVK